MALPVERWIVCVTGLRQSEGQLTGLERLQDAIHRRCSNDETRVLLRDWRDSPDAIAQRIWLRRPVDRQPVVILVGYSYGGTTANEIARELDARGIEVTTMLLIDPIWRPFRYWPSLLSVFSCWSLSVPPNVRQLYSWRQKRSRPRGHALVVDGARTHHIAHTLNVEHGYMDDHPDVQLTTLRTACPSSEAA